MHKRGNNVGGTRLACFSPPVMIATFAIEIVLALYTVWRYKLNTIGRLASLTLFFLALFQLAEYFVCGGAGLQPAVWSRIGYVAITALPPLGVHILHVLAGKPVGKIVWAAYATGAACMVYFMLYTQAFVGTECTGNYVIFQIGQWPALAYGAFYYGWLATVLVLGYRWASQLKTSKSLVAIRRRQAVLGLMVGYLVFLVPTAITNTLNPSTLDGIPSIMCGFAVLFALILAVYILPRSGLKR